jgi:hypothetical protein
LLSARSIVQSCFLSITSSNFSQKFLIGWCLEKCEYVSLCKERNLVMANRAILKEEENLKLLHLLVLLMNVNQVI